MNNDGTLIAVHVFTLKNWSSKSRYNDNVKKDNKLITWGMKLN